MAGQALWPKIQSSTLYPYGARTFSVPLLSFVVSASYSGRM